jgi:hypothetical protein
MVSPFVNFKLAYKKYQRCPLKYGGEDILYQVLHAHNIAFAVMRPPKESYEIGQGFWEDPFDIS